MGEDPDYRNAMFTVKMLPEFSAWLWALRDRKAKRIIAERIDRASLGNLGKVRDIGAGLSEMKIKFGPGYRVYCVQHGAELIILLCGGDKSTQDRDIAKAHKLAKELKP